MSYACMTADELALWRDGSASRPCVDCPAGFRASERAAGRCPQESPARLSQMRRASRRRRARQLRRDRTRAWKAELRGQVQAVRIARTNERFVLASRARMRDNDAVEYSDLIAHTVQRPASRLYSEARGVDVPEYRRNG